jgi:hypothetical protein
VDGGLVSRAGRGEHAIYQVVSRELAVAAAEKESLEAVTNLVWLAIYERQEMDLTEVARLVPYDAALTERCVRELVADGRVAVLEHDGVERISCRQLTIPVGAMQGWEAAVFDHFKAVATAIAKKLQWTGPRSRHGDVVGGTTLSFSIRPGHPFEGEVLGLLTRTREDLNALWNRVAEYNRAHPSGAAGRTEVTFYFGQTIVGPAGEGES